jgi:hypothetical protein
MISIAALSGAMYECRNYKAYDESADHNMGESGSQLGDLLVLLIKKRYETIPHELSFLLR